MIYIKSALKWALNAIQSVEGAISGIGLLITTLLMFAHVLDRYWLHLGIIWFGNLALLCFIFFMFLAATVATWQETHVKVDAFKEMVTRGKPRAISLHGVLMAFIAVALVCVFLPVIYDNMIHAWNHPEYDTLVRWFNMSWLRSVLFFALVLILVHLLVIIRRDIGNLIRIWRSKPPE